MENKQLCNVTVVFPVGSDDEAIAVKKTIAAAVAEIKEARIDFRIVSIPDGGPLGNKSGGP